ncbi:3-hydroxybutyryl-CoA dehydrogenase [Chryseobacterium rhizosphaerae]|uniref:3-hydroxybutyryl-CoA dehydrogenase n=1 Tax=Chryseobacterium rhizosphaerae TaxID=395937 RepID=A0AAE3YAN7_9FLAO|nr:MULTISPECIES: 3-hydroxyacyl-CoA dehydrogenase [Chryseobacterium]MBL3546584.1 3-hydroxyacyl-CoA dehydrogenase [Chryseobacterium sp. KMC2]MDR6528628.1 3-hydroxybutyryl-CoA dehydrogenase [Chryseobacterium rhizosphaerae]
MNIKNVTVIGTGVLGTQIAYQIAFCGYKVTVYDVTQKNLDNAKVRFKELGEIYKKDIAATNEQVDFAISNISYSLDLAEAVKDADLTSESIPESLDIKKDFYTQLSKVAKPDAIFTTNSSTLLPSKMAGSVEKPERFLALHFANNIWKQNIGEVMGHAGTDPKIFNAVLDFAKSIRMVPIAIHKEQPGYIVNSLQVPFLNAAIDLYAGGVADPETIDKTWMIGLNAVKGPFASIDIIGLTTLYNVTKLRAESGDEKAAIAVQVLKDNFIDKNKLGIATGEGFYKYPNPRYMDPDFLK